MNEKILLDKALSALRNSTDITFEDQLMEATPSTGMYSDALVKLRKNDAAQKFSVCIKRKPSVPQLGVLLSVHREKQIKSYENKMLVVADYINPNASEFLKNNKCDFIDSVGNAYLNFGSIFIYITGNKAPKAIAESKSSREVKKSSLKLIFNLLSHPKDLLSRNYRDLSKLSGVSSGSIGSVIDDLKVSKYLSEKKNGRREWLDKRSLIERWVVDYGENLRPKLVLGYYQSLQDNWQEGVCINDIGALWGGEVAADQLTRYLKPEFSTIYIEGQLGKLVLMNGLKEVSEKGNGNVEIIEKFWTFENIENPQLAPALIVYADLIASGDSRNLETAKIIYERYLDVKS